MPTKTEPYIEEHEKARKRCYTLGGACLDAYAKTGDRQLLEAWAVLRAIGQIDLSRANDAYPMPWVVPGEGNITRFEYPIRSQSENGEPVIYRYEDAVQIPDDDTCKAIAECVNTIRAIQQGVISDSLENFANHLTKKFEDKQEG